MLKRMLVYGFLTLLMVVSLGFYVPSPAAEDNNWEIPGIQAAVLSNQPALQQAAIQYIIDFDRPIKNFSPEIVEKIQAFKASSQLQMDFLKRVGTMAKLGQSIEADEPKLLQHIKTNSPGSGTERETAVSLLAHTPNPSKHRAFLNQLISDPQEHIYVKYHAAHTLGKLGTTDVIPDLVKILRDRQQAPWVRGAAALGLSELGPAAKPYLKDMGDFLRGRTVEPNDRNDLFYGNGRAMAAEGLSRFGEATQEYLPDLFQIIQVNEQSVTFYHESIARTFAEYGPVAHRYIPQLIKLLEQPEKSGAAFPRAMEILGQWGSAAKPALPYLQKFAQDCGGNATLAIARIDPNYPDALPNALRCLKKLQDNPSKWVVFARNDLKQALEVWAKQRGGLDVPTIVPLLNAAKTPEDWLLIYRLSGGRSDVLKLLRQLGSEPPNKLIKIDAIYALDIMNTAWDASGDLPNLRNQLADRIGMFIFARQWDVSDLFRLQDQHDRLVRSHPKQAAMIGVKLTSLRRGLLGLVLGGILLISVMMLLVKVVTRVVANR